MADKPKEELKFGLTIEWGKKTRTSYLAMLALLERIKITLLEQFNIEMKIIPWAGMSDEEVVPKATLVFFFHGELSVARVLEVIKFFETFKEQDFAFGEVVFKDWFTERK